MEAVRTFGKLTKGLAANHRPTQRFTMNTFDSATRARDFVRNLRLLLLLQVPEISAGPDPAQCWSCTG